MHSVALLTHLHFLSVWLNREGASKDWNHCVISLCSVGHWTAPLERLCAANLKWGYGTHFMFSYSLDQYSHKLQYSHKFFCDVKVEVSSWFQGFDVYCKSTLLVNSSPGCLLREGVLGVVLLCACCFPQCWMGDGISLSSLFSSLSPSIPPFHTPVSDSRPPAPVFVTPA